MDIKQVYLEVQKVEWDLSGPTGDFSVALDHRLDTQDIENLTSEAIRIRGRKMKTF